MHSVKHVLEMAREHFAHHQAARDFIKDEWETMMNKMQELIAELDKVEPAFQAEKARADAAEAKVAQYETDAGTALDKLTNVLAAAPSADTTSPAAAGAAAAKSAQASGADPVAAAATAAHTAATSAGADPIAAAATAAVTAASTTGVPDPHAAATTAVAAALTAAGTDATTAQSTATAAVTTAAANAPAGMGSAAAPGLPGGLPASV